jgi:hypothetical protein
VWCGNDLLLLLELDHVNDDGAKHRKNVGGYGVGLYKSIVGGTCTEEMQVLCSSCNRLKQRVRWAAETAESCGFVGESILQLYQRFPDHLVFKHHPKLWGMLKERIENDRYST